MYFQTVNKMFYQCCNKYEFLRLLILAYMLQDVQKFHQYLKIFKRLMRQTSGSKTLLKIKTKLFIVYFPRRFHCQMSEMYQKPNNPFDTFLTFAS